MIHACLLAGGLLLGPPPRPIGPYVPSACQADIDARCSSLRGGEALLCRTEADAQCDIADAEHFIADSDDDNAVARIAQACSKYEDQLNMMLADGDDAALAKAMIRYSVTSVSIFGLLAREGEVEDLGRAVLRLGKSHAFLFEVLARRGELASDVDLAAAMRDLTRHLAAALDQLARRELQRADDRLKEARGSGDGGAESYLQRAIGHSANARALVPNFAYEVSGLTAKLALADLHSVLARDDHDEAGPACAGYRTLRRELIDIQRSAPQTWRTHPGLHNMLDRADRGARACTARPRIVAGGVLLGVGALGLGTALGLYAQYDAACRFDPVARECSGILAVDGQTDRYTAQVQTALGLAAFGSALVAAGGTVMIHGIAQRRRAKPGRFAVVPHFAAGRAGATLRLNF